MRSHFSIMACSKFHLAPANCSTNDWRSFCRSSITKILFPHYFRFSSVSFAYPLHTFPTVSVHNFWYLSNTVKYSKPSIHNIHTKVCKARPIGPDIGLLQIHWWRDATLVSQPVPNWLTVLEWSVIDWYQTYSTYVYLSIYFNYSSFSQC